MSPLSPSQASSSQMPTDYDSDFLDASSEDELATSEGQLVPSLALDQVPSASSLNSPVLPYFTPRGAYDTPRSALTEERVLKLIEEGRGELILRSYALTDASALKLGEILKRQDCPLSVLKFINCGLPADKMEILFSGLEGNQTVKTLHFEGTAMPKPLCQLLQKLLAGGHHQICQLNFANVSIPVEAFSEIVSGLVSQPPGGAHLGTLCFEGCRLNENYAKSIADLISGGVGLKTLVLQGNQLGCGSVKGEASRAILAIAEAVSLNQSLEALILASNQLNAADYLALAAISPEMQPLVRFNLTGNDLDFASTDRLITKGSSPRSIAFQLAGEASPAIPTKKDSTLKFAIHNSNYKR